MSTERCPYLVGVLGRCEREVGHDGYCFVSSRYTRKPYTRRAALAAPPHKETP